jgi:hypothetical protein
MVTPFNWLKTFSILLAQAAQDIPSIGIVTCFILLTSLPYS